jgi:4-hydroxy-tetrahydrodipicolinate synthase
MKDTAFLSGIFNIVPTPFDASGALDEASLRRLVDFVVDTGVSGVTVLGFLGEAAKLSEAERARVIEISVEASDGRIPVVVGATHASTDRSVAFSVEAERRGAAGLMVAPPSLARPNDGAVRRHYEAITAAVDLPIVVQDYPPASGVYMTPQLIGSLADDIPACQWLKLEDDPTAPKTSAVLAANPAIGIFGGLGGAFMLEELQRGAVGMMTGFGFPEILVAIYQRFMSGDVEAARETFFRYLPLIRFENQAGINLPLRKYIYQQRGAIADARPRLPYPPLDDITIAELASLLDYLGLKMPGVVTVD